MPLQAQQLVSLACQEAKCPSWTSQAGQKLNLILNELCSYDMDVIRGAYLFSFNGSTGPYPLATDWLRANREDVFYTIDGVKYFMTPIELAEYDALIQQAGLNSYPQNYAVDNSQTTVASLGAPQMYVWPPANGAYPVTARYFRQMPDITTPETSSTIPWFPSQLYLQRRLTGEMMLMSGDDRAGVFLGGQSRDGFLGAQAILDRYLKTEGDEVPKTVTLDRRRFGPRWGALRDTKTTWG